ncbi:hypothetical protein TNCV_442281 [Trichonephila clavipes]|nr:hypothetical protein TNCV_442281 [Trichonephila clavipes]
MAKNYFCKKLIQRAQLPLGNQISYHNNLNADKNEIPLVQSEAIYHMFLALGLNVQLAPVERKAWNYKPKQNCVSSTVKTELKRTKIIPVVRSYTVHKMYGALGLEVDYNPLTGTTHLCQKKTSKHPYGEV